VTVVDDLVRWLRAQLDEEAARAQRAVDGSRNAFVSADEDVEPLLFDDDGAFVLPARVLREIDAKRKLLDRYERAMENRRAHPDDLASAGALLALHGAVKLLALPYADREGYEEGWAP
jgi:hypothetical protein